MHSHTLLSSNVKTQAAWLFPWKASCHRLLQLPGLTGNDIMPRPTPKDPYGWQTASPTSARSPTHINTHGHGYPRSSINTPMLRISQSIVSLGKSIVKMLCWFQSQKTTVCSFNSETQQSKMIWVNYVDFDLVFIFNQHFQRQTIKFNQNPIKWPNCANSNVYR